MTAAISSDLIASRVRELGQWFHNSDLHGVQNARDHFSGDCPAVTWRRFAHTIPAAPAVQQAGAAS